MTDETTALVTERGKVHGDFSDVSSIAQSLKSVLKLGKNWHNLTQTQREGLEMIMHKSARIVSGDPNYHDHWDDIAGYARITSTYIPQKRQES